MDKQMPEPCRTCAHGVPQPNSDVNGTCHAEPPRAFPVPVATPRMTGIAGPNGLAVEARMEVMSVWPPVKLDEPGCGRHTTAEQRLADDIRRRMVRLDPETGELSGLAQ